MGSIVYRLAMVALLGAATPWLKQNFAPVGYVTASVAYLALVVLIEVLVKKLFLGRQPVKKGEK
jgi:hypothetical protein